MKHIEQTERMILFLLTSISNDSKNLINAFSIICKIQTYLEEKKEFWLIEKVDLKARLSLQNKHTQCCEKLAASVENIEHKLEPR